MFHIPALLALAAVKTYVIHQGVKKAGEALQKRT